MRQGPCDLSFQAEVGEGRVVIPRNILNFCASRLALYPRTGPTYRAHKLCRVLTKRLCNIAKVGDPEICIATFCGSTSVDSTPLESQVSPADHLQPLLITISIILRV